MDLKVVDLDMDSNLEVPSAHPKRLVRVLVDMDSYLTTVDSDLKIVDLDSDLAIIGFIASLLTTGYVMTTKYPKEKLMVMQFNVKCNVKHQLI